MELIIDFETRSPVDIKKCGSFAYAAHHMTEALMLAVLRNDEDTPRIWIAPHIRHLYETEISDNELRSMVVEADLLVAHNAPFERWIWEFIMHRRYGFPTMPIEKFFCTMSQSLMCGFPRKLEKAIKVIAPDKAEKDMVGHKLMLKLSKPRKFLKSELQSLTEETKKKQLEAITLLSKCCPVSKEHEKLIVYHEDKDEYARFVEYCKNDVIPEKVIFNSLPKNNSGERDVWILDQIINDRGFKIDCDNANKILSTVKKFDKDRTNEASDITEGLVSSMKSPIKIKEWLSKQGIDVDSISKESIVDILQYDLPDNVREFLTIRTELGKSSTAKYESMLSYSSYDGRCHGNFIYHGATTGRWCLAEGSMVLIQDLYGSIYSKPIEEVTLYDLVWDGSSWVEHGGVVFSGVKEVIEHDGICASPRHKVFIDDETSVSLYEAKKRNLKLYTGKQ